MHAYVMNIEKGLERKKVGDRKGGRIQEKDSVCKLLYITHVTYPLRSSLRNHSVYNMSHKSQESNHCLD